MPKYFSYLFWIGIYLSVGFAIGLSMESHVNGWYAGLEKPSFNPPNWIFPVMWSSLYITIATAGWRLWCTGASKDLKILFILYTLFNWAWTPIFFGAHQLMVGFFWIMALNIVNLVLLVKARKVDTAVMFLMTPVFLWTLFAAFLNYSIWMLNS